MDVEGDLRRWAECILTGTGLSVEAAAAMAAGGPVPAGAEVPAACVEALADGWAAAHGVQLQVAGGDLS